MLVTLAGIVILVKLLQPSNALSLMLVPPLIITFFKFVFGIYDTAQVGITMLVKLVQPENT